MGRFEGFYTGGEAAVDDGGFSGSEVFAQRRLKKEREQAKVKQLEQWKLEFQKCSSQNTLKNYINIHKNDIDNPFVQQAKDKLDDMTFKSCKKHDDYKKYLSSFPSGRHTAQAQTSVNRLSSSSYISTTSTTSSDEIWEFVKKAIGLIAILAGLGMLYLWIIDEIKWTAFAPFMVFIVGPICKWAFDD